jgi:hypothetical protein
MAIKRLTVAYRSRSRPSSTLGAKASTMCPYYLDGDQVRIDSVSPAPLLAEQLERVRAGTDPVIPVCQPPLIDGG